MPYEIPFKLKEAIKNNRLIIFVGAGISRSAGLPLWKDIVIKTLESPAITKGTSFISALNDDIITPLEALDKIRDAHRKEVYETFETETSKIIENEIYLSLKKISRKFVTTNYDELIEHNTSIKAIDTSSVYNLQKIDEIHEFVLKIHGSCRAIDNAVIFTADYENLYGTNNNLAKFQLEKLASSHTCLFIGFSMSDNYITELFDKLNDIYDGLGKEHFAISTNPIQHNFVKTILINTHEEIKPLLIELGQNNSSINTQTPEEKIPQEPSIENSPTILEGGIKISIGHDTPPITENWTGRSEELKSLMTQHKVCFITGIGGQGKSALASRLLAHTSSTEYKYLDWRDFKEEGLNLQSKLFQLIELVSNGRILTSSIIGLETPELIDTFFDELKDQRGLFVFDNIDKYVDLQKFVPSGDMGQFFNRALKTPHNSKFVFTCRPFIHFAGIGFYQVKLEGLELTDVTELIGKYHTSLPETALRNIALRLHNSTQGHPLWMGLILAQSRTDASQIDQLIDKITNKAPSKTSNNLSSIISEKILDNVWVNLKDKEKIILRTLSISNISETEDDLAKIISRKLNYNQFTKALKSLKSFNLIVTKQGTEHIELHPLVREFIKTNYGREEQESYISLYVSYLDGFILLIKNKLGMILDSEELDVIIKKIEILTNTGRYHDAINELRTTSDSFHISGYCEEFLRLSDTLLSTNIWTQKKISALPGFFEFMDVFFTRTADFGEYSLFDKYIDKYLSIFTIPNSNMILAKSALSHMHWTKGDFQSAIKEGRSASDLIDMLGETDTWAGKHRYHLALRDSRDPGNINKALDYFCDNKDFESLFTPECNPSLSAKYGNIGRCLLLLGKHDESLFLTVKSYKSMSDSGNISFYDNHNLGFAAKWISETLDIQSKHQESLYFLLLARNAWKSDMPIEANKIDLVINEAEETLSNQSIINLESWQITKFCNDWVNNFYQNYLSTLPKSI